MENQEKTKEENCPCPSWFKLATCVILYRHNNDSDEQEFLLIKRKKGEIEGGKWAIPGGTGAFKKKENGELTKDILDFVEEEIRYDLGIYISDEELASYRFSIDSEKKILTAFFYCNGEKSKYREKKTSGNAIDGYAWFSRLKIGKMNERGEIAFDGGEVLDKFWKEVFSKMFT